MNSSSFSLEFQMIPISYFSHWNITKLPQTFPFPVPPHLMPTAMESPLSWEQWAWPVACHPLLLHPGNPSPVSNQTDSIDVFPKCRIIYILSDWVIGIQVLTSFKMLLDNWKTIYRHCNLCYIRKTVSSYTRVKSFRLYTIHPEGYWHTLQALLLSVSCLF